MKLIFSLFLTTSYGFDVLRLSKLVWDYARGHGLFLFLFYPNWVRTKPVIFDLQLGQVVNWIPHLPQETKWPQGKNTSDRSWSQQIMHRFSSFVCSEFVSVGVSDWISWISWLSGLSYPESEFELLLWIDWWSCSNLIFLASLIKFSPFSFNRKGQFGYHTACSSQGSSFFSQSFRPPLQLKHTTLSPRPVRIQ